MKIVIVDTTIHGPLIGGAQLFLPGLMKGLVGRGHEVHLVVKDKPDEKVQDFILDSGAVVYIKPWKKRGLVEDIAPSFAKWINALKPDIFLISVSADIGWVVLPLLDPAIATLTIGHNDSETFYMPARHYRNFLTKAIGVSQEMCDYYISRCSFPANKVEWIPYGVQASPSPPDATGSRKINLVYVGRIVEEQKRIFDLASITKKLIEKRVDFKITIVGDGPQMQEMKEKLKTEIAGGKVEFTGWLKNHEIIDILRHSEIFILTSAYEGFCIALIEAIANGCCPVVTDIRSGNNVLVQSDVNGIVVDIGNTEKFAEQLMLLANDPGKLYKMRLAAWKNGEQYSAERMINSYEKIFNSAVTDAMLLPRRVDAGFPLMESCRSKYPNWARRLKMLVTSAR